jgi:pimeloyl-ACP methyl ester carboxylesterase
VRFVRALVLGTIVLAALVIVGWWSGNEPRLDAVADARETTGVALEAGFVDVADGVRLHVVQAGPPDGPPVVLLHGFPEFWYAWRDVIPPLAAAGYRVVVPDQRGYGDSSKPAAIEAYRVDRLGDDIAALIPALGYANACVAAHDWGGGVAWNLTLRHPDRVRRLVMLDTPHPDARRIATSAEETVSWYRTAFQVPWLPEFLSRHHDWRLVTRMMRNTSLPGAFPDAKLAQYRSAWDRDGAYGTMVHWYRANAAPREGGAPRRSAVPTRLLLAPNDAFIPADLTRASLQLLDAGELVELAEGTHWVVQEHPDVVAGHVAGFCAAGLPAE